MVGFAWTSLVQPKWKVIRNLTVGESCFHSPGSPSHRKFQANLQIVKWFCYGNLKRPQVCKIFTLHQAPLAPLQITRTMDSLRSKLLSLIALFTFCTLRGFACLSCVWSLNFAGSPRACGCPGSDDTCDLRVFLSLQPVFPGIPLRRPGPRSSLETFQNLLRTRLN